MKHEWRWIGSVFLNVNCYPATKMTSLLTCIAGVRTTVDWRKGRFLEINIGRLERHSSIDPRITNNLPPVQRYFTGFLWQCSSKTLYLTIITFIFWLTTDVSRMSMWLVLNIQGLQSLRQSTTQRSPTSGATVTLGCPRWWDFVVLCLANFTSLQHTFTYSIVSKLPKKSITTIFIWK
jgi:hypothetical protein